jgi:succinate dehydrogenase / fumarate reductase cytochrome b subunit
VAGCPQTWDVISAHFPRLQSLQAFFTTDLLMNSLWTSLTRFYNSSIGKKIIVALTGVAMLLFLAGHLLGNLLVFKGPDAINAYAKWLHGLGGALLMARLGLLAAVVLHVVATIQLVKQNRAARPVAYGCPATRRATKASRTMILSGLVILSFVIFHLMHYTWGVRNNYYDPGNMRYHLPSGDHNVYNMLVDGFNWVPASIFYLISIGLLCMHLSHGFSSAFQTLGLTTRGTRSFLDLAGKVYAVGIFVGYASIPLAILFGKIH